MPLFLNVISSQNAVTQTQTWGTGSNLLINGKVFTFRAIFLILPVRNCPNIKGLIRGTIYSKEHQLQFGKIYLLFVLEVKEETSDRSTFKQWHGWHILYVIAICFAKHIVIELLREYIITTHWMHYQSISKLKVAATDREKTRYIRSSRKFFGFHAKLLFCRGKHEAGTSTASTLQGNILNHELWSSSSLPEGGENSQNFSALVKKVWKISRLFARRDVRDKKRRLLMPCFFGVLRMEAFTKRQTKTPNQNLCGPSKT